MAGATGVVHVHGHVNMRKTKILVSGINLYLLKKSVKGSCGVCQTGNVAMQYSVVAARVGCIRNAVSLRDPFALTLSSGVSGAFGQLGLLMEEKIQGLMLEN